MVPIALGEQTGGSNLRPAAYCGVDALKPTFGRISRFGCYPFTWSLDHVGIIGLNMEDIALVLSIISGPDHRDPTTLPDPAPPAQLDLDRLEPPRIGIVRNFFPELTEPVMMEAIEKAAMSLKEAGAEMFDLMLPQEFGLTWPAHKLISSAEMATVTARRPVAVGKPAASDKAFDKKPGPLIPATYYLQAQRIRHWLYDKLLDLFRDLDALLMAVAPGPAPKGLASAGDSTLLSPWSLLGYPAISINGGLSPEGLPLGLQFVGAPMADHRLLEVGAWCEAVLGRLPAPLLP